MTGNEELKNFRMRFLNLAALKLGSDFFEAEKRTETLKYWSGHENLPSHRVQYAERLFVKRCRIETFP